MTVTRELSLLTEISQQSKRGESRSCNIEGGTVMAVDEGGTTKNRYENKRVIGKRTYGKTYGHATTGDMVTAVTETSQ